MDKRAGNNGIKYDGCNHFYNAIKKYGWENFSSEILEEGLSKEKAEEREIYWIEKYQATDPEFGFNIARGGNLAFPFEQCHKVNAYTLDGKFVQTFPSVGEAEKFIGKAGVSDVCRGKSNRAGGYHWRYTSDEFPAGKDLENYFFRNKKVVPINQYTLEGKFVKTFHSLNEAARETGINFTSIWDTCNGRRKRAGEFTFRRYDDFSGCKDIGFVYQSPEKEVNAYSLEGKYLGTYKNLNEAARQLGLISQYISLCCKRKKESVGNYIFRFTSEVEPGVDIEGFDG